MSHFINFISKLHKWLSQPSEPPLEIPDFGPVNIPDYSQFLKTSSIQFLKKWETLKNSKKVRVKLKEHNCSLDNFQKLTLIGAGSFGQVYLVINDRTANLHAMKAVLKKTVVDSRQVENTRTELIMLHCTNCPFTLRLDFFFKDNSYLYFIVPFIQGGELFRHLRRAGRFDEHLAKFYLAQVILALEYLHYLDFVYRDLKPENILLDHTGYIKLSDFGFCKHLNNKRTYTICGTPEYFAPEILKNEGYGKAVDWWMVGVLAFELTTGFCPFKEKDDDKMFVRIMKGNYKCPSFMSVELNNLIKNTLQVDLTRRYGTLKNGVNDFKDHRWFRPLNWQAVVSRKAKPDYIPFVEGSNDTRHFRDYEYKPLKVARCLEYGEEFLDF